jgi:hypothetical protein
MHISSGRAQAQKILHFCALTSVSRLRLSDRMNLRSRPLADPFKFFAYLDSTVPGIIAQPRDVSPGSISLSH